MKRRLFSLVLALILVLSILPIGTAGAAANLASSAASPSAKVYGTVYALNQPVIFDWSEYASYGVSYRCSIYNLKTKNIDQQNELGAQSFDVFMGDVKGSYLLYVQFFDANGNQTKELFDCFHIGAAVMDPEFTPEETVRMRGVPAKDAKKYPAFSKKHQEANAWILIPNLLLAFFEGYDDNPNLWLNKLMNVNFTLDSINVIRKGYASSKYDYNQLFEYNLFTLVNEYRLLNGKPKLLWNDALGSFGRLRATAASDNPMKNNTYDLSEIGDSTGSLIPDFYRYGLAAPSEGVEWFWTDTRKLDWDSDASAQAIFDRWLSDESMRVDMLGDFKYVGIGAVRCSRLLGKKQTGIAMMVEFEN